MSYTWDMISFQETECSDNIRIILPLSVIPPQTLFLIFHFENIIGMTSVGEAVSWSCGTLSVEDSCSGE